MFSIPAISIKQKRTRTIGGLHATRNLPQNFLVVMEQSGRVQNIKPYWFKSKIWIKEIPNMDFFKELEQ